MTPARSKRRWWLWLLLAAWTVTPAAHLHAHSMPNSIVMLDFLRDGVAAELTLPMNELELGFKQPLMTAPTQVIERHGAALREYVLAHIQPLTPDGRKWSVEVRRMSVLMGQTQPDLIVRLWMRPPPDAPLRRFTLEYSVICHEVMSHAVMVSVRNDWDSATFATRPVFLGAIQFVVTSLKVDRTHGSFWRGFGSVLRLGMRHIADGYDHLLFLFVLLLPAPLLAAGPRWGGFRGGKPSFVQLLKIVTAFTVGHSLTLVIGGLGWLRLPGQPVEVLIAVSILVSAIHAIRPWFAGREPWIAGGFGLVHGLAFASSIAEFGYSPWHLAMTVLGFNVGIELMQLALVAAVVPALLLLSRTRFYTPLRIGGAVMAIVAALIWIGARVQSPPADENAKSTSIARANLDALG